MSTTQAFDQAISLLKNAVKYSTIENQKHIDLTLVSAEDRFEYQKALVIVQSAVKRGEYTQSEVNEKLGII